MLCAIHLSSYFFRTNVSFLARLRDAVCYTFVGTRPRYEGTW